MALSDHCVSVLPASSAFAMARSRVFAFRHLA
jgi:hypothetical protein